MQAEGTDVVPQWPTAEGFHNRAAAVFSSLEGSLGGTGSKNAPWSLSQDHVFKAGKANDYSSEEDEDAKEMDERQRVFLPGSMLELEGEGNEDEVFRPSAAFCKAMDKEQEYDDTDAMAMGERLEDADTRPASNTEVMEDNVYEQRTRQQAEAGVLLDAGPKGVEAMQIEHAEDGTEQQAVSEDTRPSGIAHTPEVVGQAALTTGTSASVSAAANGNGVVSTAVPEAQDDEDEQRRAKKKVRFQESWVPPHRREDDKGAELRRRPPAAPKPGPGRSLSYVPDHVKNPQRYTCYVLDEPITVGGGDQGTATADGGQADMERAARAAISAARSAPELEQPGGDSAAALPAFGSGIQFRPQSKRTKEAVPAAEMADKPSGGRAVELQLGQEDFADDGQDLMEVARGEAASSVVQPRKPRRNFRAKSADTDRSS